MPPLRAAKLVQRLFTDPGLPRDNPTPAFWQQPYPEGIPNIQSVTLPQTIRDVVIIGSGITGCSVARQLLLDNPSVTVTVLEARGLCSGATGRNGGNIKTQPINEYERFSKRFGHEKAVELVRFSISHFEAILKATREIDPAIVEAAELRSVEAVSVIMDRERVAELRKTHETFERAFPDLKGVYTFLELEEMQRLGYKNALAGIKGPAAAAWPYRLISGLFRALITRYPDRFTIETHTPALEIKKTANDGLYSIITPRGVLKARHVVHCTEGHATKLLPSVRGILWPRRGQMSIQKPAKNFPSFDGKYSWTIYYADGFDYACQNAKTGDLFIGGGDLSRCNDGFQRFANPSDATESTFAKKHLRGVQASIFGASNEGIEESSDLTHSWTGIMCNSLDGLPLIGKIPQEVLQDRPQGDGKNGGEWIAAGFGGYGMVNCWRSGQALASMLLGRGTPSWLPGPMVISSERLASLFDDLESKVVFSPAMKAML